MTFVQKEIVVVELNRIDSIFALQVLQDRGSALRRLHSLAAFVHRNHSAKLAAKRTTHTGVMDSSSPAEKRRQNVFLGIRQTMIRRPRKLIERTHGPFGIVHAKAEIVFVGQPANIAEFSGPAQRSQQL